MARPLVVTGALLANLACQGLIGDSLDKLPTGQVDNAACDATTRGRSENRMRRLTRDELTNTLGDLFGSELSTLPAVHDELETLPADELVVGLDDIAESPSDAQFGVMLRVGAAIADKVASADATAKKLLGTCATTAAIDDTCLRNFITTFGAKIERRPLASTEVDALVGFYKTKGGAEGLKRLVMRLVMSPSLVYHVEIGADADENGRARLTDYEVASRVAYRVTGSMPDEALLSAAANGELQDIAVVEDHVRRLLSTERGKEKMAAYFRYYLHLDQATDPLPATAALHGIEVEGFAEEAIQETRDLHEYLTFNEGTMRDLFTSTVAFARTDRLAKVLNTTAMTDDVTPVQTTPEHSGVLLRPAAMSQSGARTNPMRRSSVVMRRVLCQAFGELDPALVSAVTDTLPYDPDTVSNREHYQRMTTGPDCIVCHQRLNPVGFALEAYDQTGSVRSQEQLFDMDGKKTVAFAIETQVSDPFDTTKSLSGAAQLMDAIANHEDLPMCFAQTMFEYVRKREAARTDSCALGDIAVHTANDGSILETFVASIATEDIFYKAVGN